ncbi:MAG TPA: zinc-binding alcohol dehydrogenase [Planctomycetota bacterium]|nr:zinc-binding alcohol dehydrogenase [Planctomycetota bacterium]
MPKRLVFTGKQQVSLESFELDNLNPGQVRLKSICSLMSTGTENICFNRLFEPGSHWDRWVKYPFYPGYSTVAQVEAVGEGVTQFKAGDRVVTRRGHASHHIVNVDQCSLLPEGIDVDDAAWFALAKITAMGARAAQYQLGDSVVIIGAGPIGQMSIRWAAAAGAQRIIVADIVEMRLKMALAGGATHTVARSIDQALEEIKALNGGQQPRLVIDTTGNETVFTHALALPARFGRVVVLGDTGMPTHQHLTSDVITRGITIVGAHDGHETPEWNGPRIYSLFFDLLKSKRFNVAGLNTHTFTPAECKKAYEVCNTQRGQTMGILFDWSR